jgi:hypothetical protein
MADTNRSKRPVILCYFYGINDNEASSWDSENTAALTAHHLKLS